MHGEGIVSSIKIFIYVVLDHRLITLVILFIFDRDLSDNLISRIDPTLFASLTSLATL